MAIVRGQLVKELEPGLNALFGWNIKDMKISMLKFIDTETFDRAFEEEVMLSGFANAQVKPEGSGVLLTMHKKLSLLDTLMKQLL